MSVHSIHDARARAEGHRTSEQIRAQLEARLAEMEIQARSPQYSMPCETCRWADRGWCRNPLIVGLENQDTINWDRHAAEYAPKYGTTSHRRNGLCGPEKALWEAKPTPRSLFQRLLDWIDA